MSEHKIPRKEFVVYVTAIASVKVLAVSDAMAAEAAAKAVRQKLTSVDSNVYIPKVAVVTADMDEETKKNIAEGRAPWLEKSGTNTDESKLN